VQLDNVVIVRRTYREDIDWLRAIAVLAVVAFHFEAPAIYGGFVGVDIFFVISGYYEDRPVGSSKRHVLLCAIL
jgi:surface polysaccharide O-acyltransferase-like enzyme